MSTKKTTPLTKEERRQRGKYVANFTYCAEEEVFKTRRHDKRACGLDGARRWAARICGWYGIPDVAVTRMINGEPNGLYSARDGTIKLGSKAPFWVVLHELAHHVSWVLDRSRGHDSSFRRRYVEIIRRVFDDAEAERLVASFKKWGLDL